MCPYTVRRLSALTHRPVYQNCCWCDADYFRQPSYRSHQITPYRSHHHTDHTSSRSLLTPVTGCGTATECPGPERTSLEPRRGTATRRAPPTGQRVQHPRILSASCAHFCGNGQAFLCAQCA
eukprot:363813-Chlamydomonas_euryale.AAC.1